MSDGKLVQRKLESHYHPDEGWIVVDDNYCGAPDAYCPMGRGTSEREAIIDYWEQVGEELA